MQSYSQPSVPSLYFVVENSITDSTTTPELPSELLHRCLTSYAHWGDLAKLACVQKSWSNIVIETANQSSTSQWELANALLNGDCGLQKSPERAVQILKSLADVPIDEKTGKPIIIIEKEKEKPNTISDNTTDNEDDYLKIIRSSAMKKIAECYLEGIGVESSNNNAAAVAVAWIETSYFIFRDSDAAYEMGTIYERGRHGIEVDVVAAAEWFERGAVEGNIESMVELALCYELGAGVTQSDENALDWYTKAANLGHATAKFAVGEIFEEARGVPQSDAEACIWYFEAAQTGCQDSKLALRRLYSIARIVVPGVTTILKE